MKFEYPIKEINDENVSANLGSLNHFGFYPISRFNSWHGGYHVEGEGEGIRAIAAGKIIAYRIPKDNTEEIIGDKKYQYSNGFVLIKHEYKSPKEQELTFYSLYMHLLPKKFFANKTRFVPVPFTNRSGELKGLTARHVLDGSKPFVIPLGEIVDLHSDLDAADTWLNAHAPKYKKVTFKDKNGRVWTDICLAITVKCVEALDGNKYKIKTEEDKGPVPECHSFNTRGDGVDDIISCSIPIKAGQLIGYSGQYGFEKQPNYFATHIEVFTPDDVSSFLSDSKDDGKDEKHYFRVKKGAVLKKAYPGMIPGGGKIKVKEGPDFSEVQLQSLTRTVKHADLVSKGKINGVTNYDIAGGHSFKDVNTVFEHMLKNGSVLIWEADFVEGTVQKRQVRYELNPAGKKYWIPTSSNPPGTGEIRDFTTALTTLYEHKPIAGQLQDTVDEEVILPIKSLRKATDSDKKEWYYIVIGEKKGWIKKDDRDLISAYNWKEFGFNIVKDEEDLYLYDPASPPKFLKDIWAKIDTDGNKVLSTRELQNAFKNPGLAKKLSQMVCYHTSEWDWSDNWNSYKTKIKELYKEGIDKEEDGNLKKQLETKRDQTLDALQARLNALCFWKEVKTHKPLGQHPNQMTSPHPGTQTSFWGTNYVELPVLTKPIVAQPAGSKDFPEHDPKVYHFHPIAFVEQMRKIFSGTCYCYSQGIVTKPCNEKGIDIRDEDYEKLANDLSIDKAIILAIAKQESKRSPFVRSNPKHAAILLERHYVYRLLSKKRNISDLVRDHPDLIYSVESSNYGTYLGQIERLSKVKEWDIEVAIQSCSWGKFQVMGEYYKTGNHYKNAIEFENAMNMCGLQHLKYLRIFLEEVKGSRMMNAIKTKDWEIIAEEYNGKKWRKINPDYASNLEKYYDEFKD